MELRVLNYFLMVAREENITKAANLLHVTQPTLSRQLMQLEDELGAKLFERTSHSIILTEDGQILKRRAKEILSLVKKTQEEILQEEELTGEISIGSGEMKSVGILTDAMKEFSDKNPGVHFNMYSGNADEIKERIENGLLDMGVLMEPVDIGKYDFIKLPVKERWGIVVRDDSPLAHKEYITPQDLKDLPLIMGKRLLIQKQLLSWFGNSTSELNVVSTYNLIYNAVKQVKSGIGTLLCIDLDVKYEGVKFIPLNPVLEVGTVVVWKKNQTTSHALEKFIHCLEKQIKVV